MASQITPHFVTRQVFCGAGKVGCELPGRADEHVPYQLSQRADFFEEEIGLETTLKRPIVNTRDEPHADAQKYRRLHVIVGDANMSEVATYLKVGTTAIVLAMIEDDELGDDWLLGNPVAAIRQVSHDPSLAPDDHAPRRQPGDSARDPVGAARTGTQVRAVATDSTASATAIGADILDQWEAVLTGLEADPNSVANWVDWVAKQRLVDGYAARHDIEPGSAKLKAIDLQYHDLRLDRCLALRAGLDTMVSPTRWPHAMTEPPTHHPGLLPWPLSAEVSRRCRSSQLGLARVRHRPRSAAPGPDDGTVRGTADHVGTLIDESETARRTPRPSRPMIAPMHRRHRHPTEGKHR